MTPGGIRLGSPALTTRGMNEDDMRRIIDWCLKAIEVAKRIQEKAGKKLEDFNKALEADEEVPKFAAEVRAWASQFPMPGQ